MTSIDVQMVKALVVARCRELWEHPVSTLAILEGLTVLATLQVVMQGFGHGRVALCALNAAALGSIVGYIANPRVRWSQLGGTATVGGDVVPAMPVTAGERMIAVGTLGAAMASPFAVVTLLSGLLLSRSTVLSVALTLSGVILGFFTFPVVRQLGIGPVRRWRAVPSAWWAVLRPKRGSEISVAYWALLPGVALGGLVPLSLLPMLMVVMPADTMTEFGPVPPAYALALLTASGSSLGGVSRLMTLAAPFSRVAVSRRALAFAELRLVPLQLIVNGALTLGLVHGLTHDSALAQATGHVVVLLTCAGAVVCVWWARLVMPGFGADVIAAIVVTVLLALCVIVVVAGAAFVLLPAAAAPLSVGALSALALTAAVALAHTAPRHPLSREPGDLESAVLRKVGVL